jgi:hypothetical protein
VNRIRITGVKRRGLQIGCEDRKGLRLVAKIWWSPALAHIFYWVLEYLEIESSYLKSCGAQTHTRYSLIPLSSCTLVDPIDGQ